MRGRTITFKYKNFKYSNETNEALSSAILNSKDEDELSKIYAHYNSLDINRGYKYIIKDLYILVNKIKMSTSDIAAIYEVSPRTIQIWLKELTISRSQKEAQKIAATKRDYTAIRKTYEKNVIEKITKSLPLPLSDLSLEDNVLKSISSALDIYNSELKNDEEIKCKINELVNLVLKKID